VILAMKIRDHSRITSIKNCDEVIKTAKVLAKKKNQTTNYFIREASLYLQWKT
jgi:predicted DNA-binding protein